MNIIFIHIRDYIEHSSTKCIHSSLGWNRACASEDADLVCWPLLIFLAWLLPQNHNLKLVIETIAFNFLSHKTSLQASHHAREWGFNINHAEIYGTQPLLCLLCLCLWLCSPVQLSHIQKRNRCLCLWKRYATLAYPKALFSSCCCAF